MAIWQITFGLPDEELGEPDLDWRPWAGSFAAGFLLGGISDMLALWLFAQWMAHH